MSIMHVETGGLDAALVWCRHEIAVREQKRREQSEALTITQQANMRG